jgi:hypothetical protein
VRKKNCPNIAPTNSTRARYAPSACGEELQRRDRLLSVPLVDDERREERAGGEEATETVQRPSLDDPRRGDHAERRGRRAGSKTPAPLGLEVAGAPDERDPDRSLMNRPQRQPHSRDPAGTSPTATPATAPAGDRAAWALRASSSSERDGPLALDARRARREQPLGGLRQSARSEAAVKIAIRPPNMPPPSSRRARAQEAAAEGDARPEPESPVGEKPRCA